MAEHIDRLGLSPQQRLITMGGLSGTYGFFHGIAQGARVSSLRFLAENAHRLPRTKGTWYFFHKRKNNVLLRDGINAGAKTGLKYSSATCLFFGLEAAFDELYSKITWMSTASSAVVLGSAIAFWQQLPFKQSLRSVRNFAIGGAIAGLVQDRVRAISQKSRDERFRNQEEALKNEALKNEELKNEELKKDAQVSQEGSK